MLKKFQRMKIKPVVSLGEKLKAAREAAHLGVSRLAQEVAINKHWLSWLEKGAYHKLPSEFYLRQSLKRLAKELKMNETQVFNDFDREYRLFSVLKKEKQQASKQVKVHKPLIVTRIVVALFIITIILLVGWFVGWRALRLFAAPTLALTQPSTELITTAAKLNIMGVTEPEIRLIINGHESWSNGTGNFQDTVILREGVNEVSVTVYKKFHAPVSIERRIIYQP